MFVGVNGCPVISLLFEQNYTRDRARHARQECPDKRKGSHGKRDVHGRLLWYMHGNTASLSAEGGHPNSRAVSLSGIDGF